MVPSIAVPLSLNKMLLMLPNPDSQRATHAAKTARFPNRKSALLAGENHMVSCGHQKTSKVRVN